MARSSRPSSGRGTKVRFPAAKIWFTMMERAPTTFWIPIEPRVGEPNDEECNKRLSSRGLEGDFVARQSQDVVLDEHTELIEEAQRLGTDKKRAVRGYRTVTSVNGRVLSVHNPCFLQAFDAFNTRSVRRLVDHHELTHEVT
jgi:hypothetical protein